MEEIETAQICSSNSKFSKSRWRKATSSR